MQAAVQQQPGARSPKSSLALPHTEHTKGKKRERTDSGSLEPSSKRTKDDLETSFVKVDRCITRPEEISSITDEDGGLSSIANVEKLVALMQQDRNDGTRKPIEVASRQIILAGVVASTDKQECRDKLVQLGGLAVLDDWLQEAHKGKTGDGENPTEVDEVLDDLLLTLLRALQNLPVDLDALKTCAVGKSVNNLKNHRNSEIQKKARKLVETWKKRVDAEMKQSGEKPGTPGKQQPSSGDPLQTLTLAKDAKSSTKLNVPAVADAQTKSVGSATSKSGTTASSKENSPNNSGSNEIQGVSVKEENSCASQAQNYGPTWSSAPVTSACKEEVKPVSKSTRSADTGLKENGSKWSSRTNTNAAAERPVGAEKSPGETEAPPNQRLILRFPNPSKSPARVNGESQTTTVQVSSPKVLDRSSSSGLGDGTKSKHHAEISSEKRHRDDSVGVLDGKLSEKTSLQEDHSKMNGVDGGMSMLATTVDDVNRCDGSSVTVSTGKSVVTEGGNAEQDNLGMSSVQVPSSEQVREDATKGDRHECSTDLHKMEHPEEGKPDPQLDRKLSDVDNRLKREGSGSPASPEEDALEVAWKVAKEVEQEVEGYNKPRSTDTVKEVQPPEEPPAPPPESGPSAAEDEVTSDENERNPDRPSTGEARDPVPREAEGASRPLFDLNEGFPAEESPTFVPPSHPVPVTLSAPIPVMASSGGAFIPVAPANSLKTEVGWKGAAATSAFRPAEPRAAQEKKAKLALDIDLNIADGEEASTSNLETHFSTVAAARSLSSFPSTSAVEKMGLDLNQVNEGDEGGSLRLRQPGTNSSNVNILRNFDLNDGPEEPQTGDAFLRSLKPKTNPVPSPIPNMGNMNGELLNLSSWFGVPGLRSDSYPAQQYQHAYMNGGAGGAFASDLYRAAAGASSSMLGYQASAPQALYTYPNFPFPFSSSSTFVAPTPYVSGSTVPATISSQVVNSAVSAFARPPYFMGVTENGGSLEVGNSWGRRGLDLNADPDSSTAMGTASVGILGDSEGRQPYVIPVNDPMRAFHQAASLKRKEPETGWDNYRGWR